MSAQGVEGVVEAGGDAGHAQRRRRQRRAVQAEFAVARCEAGAAVVAVIPGAHQFQRAQRPWG